MSRKNWASTLQGKEGQVWQSGWSHLAPRHIQQGQQWTESRSGVGAARPSMRSRRIQVHRNHASTYLRRFELPNASRWGAQPISLRWTAWVIFFQTTPSPARVSTLIPTVSASNIPSQPEILGEARPRTCARVHTSEESCFRCSKKKLNNQLQKRVVSGSNLETWRVPKERNCHRNSQTPVRQDHLNYCLHWHS